MLHDVTHRSGGVTLSPELCLVLPHDFPHGFPMPIVLGENTVKRTRASWHRDQDINRRQGELLAKDVLATRQKLLNELLTQRFGPGVLARPDLLKRVKLLVDAGGLTWVTWREPWQPRPEAIAVFTHPKTRIQGFHLICEWHWKPLGNDRN